MEKWWDQPIRAVTLEFPASDVANLDVKSIIDETAEGAVNLLVTFATGYFPGGTTFYQSRIAPHYPGLGCRDLLSEAIEQGHKNGQKVIAYLASIWGGRDMYEAHPDWAQKKANGDLNTWDEELNTVAMCPNSPYRAYFSSLVEEISNNYDVDGFYFDEPSFQSWCSCENCRERFKKDTGLELPVEEEWESETFKTFIDWRYRIISAWRKELFDLSKKDNRCILFQGAFPLGKLRAEISGIAGLPSIPNPYQLRFGVEWPVPLSHGTFLPEAVVVGDILHFELYRVAINEPLWWYAVALRYGQSIAHGKQMLVLNMMAQTPFDLYGLPEAEICLSTAEVLANGGMPLFSRYYPDRVDQTAWNNVYKMLQDSKVIDPFLTDRSALKYTAVLFSQRTSDYYDQKFGSPAHLSEMKGFAKILLQNHILFDIVTEDDLDRLSEYKTLILPNTSCLSKDAKDKIRCYVNNGGGLIASYESGLLDERANPSGEDNLGNVLGISYLDEPCPFTGFDVYMKMAEGQKLVDEGVINGLVPTGGVQLNVDADSARAIANVMGGSTVHYGPLGNDIGSPTVTMHEIEGSGRVVYFATPIGNRYLEFGIGAHAALVTSAVSWTAGEDPQVILRNAPKTLALSVYEQAEAKRLIIHLVNSVRDDVNRPINELNACQGVKLLVRTDAKPAKVFHPVEGDIKFLYQNGIVNLEAPEFSVWSTIVIDF
jgi:hypothetical protein